MQLMVDPHRSIIDGPNPIDKIATTTANRRKLVATMMLDRVPIAEIAKATGVTEGTIFKDKRYLERVWQRLLAEDYTVLRYREVMALDRMEQEAIRRYNSSDVTTIPIDELRETVGPGMLAAMVSDNGKWFDRRIKLMEMRAKILGLFPKAEQITLNQISNEDNRQIVQIVVSPPTTDQTQHNDRTRKQVPYGEWITGVLNPPPESEQQEHTPYTNGSHQEDD